MVEDRAEIDLEQLVLDHHREIYAYAYRLCGSRGDAEDLAQAVFLTAQEKIGQLRDAASARAWLYAVLRSHFHKLCRKRKPVPEASLELNLDQLAETPETRQAIDSEQLQRALDALPDPYRLVLVMFYFDDCSYREIAKQLDLPIGTVMSRLARAKGRVRTMLASDEDIPSVYTESAGRNGGRHG